MQLIPWPFDQHAFTTSERAKNFAILIQYLMQQDQHNSPNGLGLVPIVMPPSYTKQLFQGMNGVDADLPANLYKVNILTRPEEPVAPPPAAAGAAATAAQKHLFEMFLHEHKVWTRKEEEYREQLQVLRRVKTELFSGLTPNAQEELVIETGEFTRGLDGSVFTLSVIVAKVDTSTALDQPAKEAFRNTIATLKHTPGDNPVPKLAILRTAIGALNSSPSSAVNADEQVAAVVRTFGTCPSLRLAMTTYASDTIDTNTGTFEGMASSIVKAFKINTLIPGTTPTTATMGFANSAVGAPSTDCQDEIVTAIKGLGALLSTSLGQANAATGANPPPPSNPTGGGAGRGNGRRGQPVPANAQAHVSGSRKSYCSTHGYGGHSSIGCLGKSATHDDTADWDNNKGGSQDGSSLRLDGTSRKFYA
jgi:hypothetical protein